MVIDAGTNREELRNNPNYLGNRHERVRGDRYYDFIDQFVQTAERLFPKLYLHWEDFGRLNAANILEKYRKQIPTFNDDIQGTGIVTLGGIFGALDITGEKIKRIKFISAMVVGLLVQGLLLVSFVKWLVKVCLKKKLINASLWSTNKVSFLMIWMT